MYFILWKLGFLKDKQLSIVTPMTVTDSAEEMRALANIVAMRCDLQRNAVVLFVGYKYYSLA